MKFSSGFLYLCVVGQNSILRQLTERVTHRLQQAYTPKTWKTYKNMFILYMSFCVCMGLAPLPFSLLSVLTFVEFLAFNNLQPASINNYVSALRFHGSWFNYPTDVLQHPRLTALLKAVYNTSKSAPKFKGVFDIPTLTALIQVCEVFPSSILYKSLYLLSFFGFLRISNLLPSSITSFDPFKQLCRGDVLFYPQKAIVVLKWSKTIRSLKTATYIVIPRLHDSILCPVNALLKLYDQFPMHTNAPLFSTREGIITQSQARAHLKKCLHILRLDTDRYTFHTFRRSGATIAFNNDVQIQFIKRHGTWQSDAVDCYLISDLQNASKVADMFTKLLATTTT